MSKINSLLSIALLVLTAVVAFSQDLRPVFDGTLTEKPPSALIGKSEEALFRKEILLVARRAWKRRQTECTGGWEEKPSIIGIAQGSFTKANTRQDALLYNYCIPAHAYSFNGLAIIEDGRVVAHVAYQSDWQNEIQSLPDINQNGRSEIVLVSGTTNQGTTWSAVTLVEFADAAIHKFGYTDAYSDSCGADESAGAEASKLSVKAGVTPVFYRERFKKGCSQTKWRRAKASERIILDQDATEYQRVR